MILLCTVTHIICTSSKYPYLKQEGNGKSRGMGIGRGGGMHPKGKYKANLEFPGGGGGGSLKIPSIVDTGRGWEERVCQDQCFSQKGIQASYGRPLLGKIYSKFT